MEYIFNGFIAILSLCVTAAILWYGIRFLKAQTELTELKMDKIKKEIELLEAQKRTHNS
ncbi:hypothetical protein [Solitalea lacus]|uniref:hypothetical protein n=1 Tax=Solitalea lacus TaxID=2911172 RepID=UPI001EDA0048|nr:hypothetical protein [Solitalea lacus]UKJ07148.1 hypothetical protein L2B55_16675 [Solitalea lacus]